MIVKISVACTAPSRANPDRGDAGDGADGAGREGARAVARAGAGRETGESTRAGVETPCAIESP
ncbi:hypothetical protein OG618_05180 [Kitasatospora sp. NBC_01246]|uniref:hypothetical protein n=1 Tax=Kitasatospora sp. NBC_01246 TaxID=2903570 RepID=UPI002E33A3F7|nr:hypothetical protein [Kitasatospora sp. NBC_01246]